MEACEWWCSSEAARKYHDEEWGVPVHEDWKHLEGLTLEVMQCGLSWNTVLGKRQIFRECFGGFDIERVSRLTDGEVQRILDTPGMIRSERKVRATVGNAGAMLRIMEEFGSFDAYIWGFTGGCTLVYGDHVGKNVSENELSRVIAADLKKRGFRYLGAVTVYSYLQACGLVNDHGPGCPCYEKILGLGPYRILPRDEGCKFTVV